MAPTPVWACVSSTSDDTLTNITAAVGERAGPHWLTVTGPSPNWRATRRRLRRPGGAPANQAAGIYSDTVTLSAQPGGDGRHHEGDHPGF